MRRSLVYLSRLEEIKAAKVLAMRLEESVLTYLSVGEGLKLPSQPSLWEETESTSRVEAEAFESAHPRSKKGKEESR